MTTKYLIRTREDLEDGYLGRPVDIVKLTANEEEAKAAYIKYALASIEDIEIHQNLDWSFTDSTRQQLALQYAHEYCMEHDDIHLLDEGEIQTYCGLPEDLSDSTQLKVAEILHVCPLKFDEIKDPSYAIYLPHISDYLYYEDEFPDELRYSVKKNAEFAFGSQPDFVISDPRPEKFTDELLKTLMNLIPNEIKAESIEELTHAPDQLRTLLKTLEEDFIFTETEDIVSIKIRRSFYDRLSMYKNISKFNSLLKTPFFVEKALTPDEVIALYEKYLEKIASYFED